MDNLEQPRAIAYLKVIVYDDNSLVDDFNGTAEDIANIFLTLGKSELQYRAALIAACHTLLIKEGLTLEEFVGNAISKMN
jgi:hypothetical protein